MNNHRILWSVIVVWCKNLIWSLFRSVFTLLVLIITLFWLDNSVLSSASAQTDGKVPGNSLGQQSDAQLWRSIRQSMVGVVSNPNTESGRLVQSSGESWRSIRNGPLSTYGVWILAGMVGLLLIYFLLRGRIKIEAGLSGDKIERFEAIDRFAHWLTAGSFVILALTGLNLLYGRYLFGPEIYGSGLYAQLTLYGKMAHNYLAFGFMAGLILIAVLWIKDNIPRSNDLIWLSKGGGLFSKHSHPPAYRFNAGQKLVFWSVLIGGISLAVSGLSLMFPYEMPLFSSTFTMINSVFGTELPGTLTPIQEMQFTHIWHAIVALVLTSIIIAHIYIGSIGMEGAFDAMGTGMVDKNWAKEHHSLWVTEIEKEKSSPSTT